MLRCAILCLLFLFAGAHAAETKVYQWTDENGVVHFTTQPPPEEVQAAERTVREIPKAGTVATKAPGREETDPASAETDTPETAQVDPADQERLRMERCEQGRAWVAGIEPADRIRVERPDGTVEFLEGEDRIAELQRARQMVAENCP
ncbi:MAG: DUF4124 domain-containing protein [Xanthomonadales bacterium]|nr:DUF4124 domain-containing protein [Xanthomonadales bacterium]